MPRKNSFGLNIQNNFPIIATAIVILLFILYLLNKKSYFGRGSGKDHTSTNEGCNNSALAIANINPSYMSNGYFSIAESKKGIKNKKIDSIINNINEYNKNITDEKDKIIAFEHRDSSSSNKRLKIADRKRADLRNTSKYYTQGALDKAINNKIQISEKFGSAYCHPIKGVNTYCLDKDNNVFNNCLSKIK